MSGRKLFVEAESDCGVIGEMGNKLDRKSGILVAVGAVDGVVVVGVVVEVRVVVVGAQVLQHCDRVYDCVQSM